MTLPDLSDIERNAEEIVRGVGLETIGVYRFLFNEFARGAIIENYVFQFTYRSFYRIDNAGLTPEFKRRYFALMDDARDRNDVNIPALARELFILPNRKGQQSLQFSFITKLVNTVNPQYPIYDAEVASFFGFRAPYNYKSFEVRLTEYMAFYAKLRDIYAAIIHRNLLLQPRQLFREKYAVTTDHVPEIKVLDFIFWSAGKLSLEAEQL
jgi:hypothetical protein